MALRLNNTNQNPSNAKLLTTSKERQMEKAQIVSFDLDGTITDSSFADSVWLQGLPRQYAHEKSVTFEEAKKEVKKEYDKVGRMKLEWYDLQYWIKKFGLNTTPQKVLNEFKDRINMFPELPEVFEKLREKGFRLIVVSNAHREFVDLEIEKTRINGYFQHIFSSTSDFGLLKNDPRLYRKICTICQVSPQQMIHVGDDCLFDFEAPRKLGIHAFYLDRTNQCKEQFTIRSLQELNEKLETAPT